MRRTGPPIIAVLLLCVALGAVAWQYAQRPSVLRVAVGPIGSEDVRLVAGIAQYLAREKAPYRFRMVLADNPQDAAKRLDDGTVDLAVIRSDLAVPVEGLTAMVLRRAFAILITSADSRIERVTDLRGRTVGVTRNAPGNVAFLQTILAHYELPRDSVKFQLIETAERGQALKDGTVDAVLPPRPQSAATWPTA